MSDPLRLAMLHGLAAEVVAEGVPGDVVECGVCNGGSAAVLAAGFLGERARKLWLYDTFEGLPAPGAQDGALAPTYAGEFVGRVEEVRRAVASVDFPWERAVVRKGLFKNTFNEERAAAVALLHVDADWYESTLLALQTFYPLVPVGGYVVIDDFGYWEGARKAFYAFCRDAGEEPLLERAGETQAFWRKGGETNRDRAERYQSGIFRPPRS